MEWLAALAANKHVHSMADTTYVRTNSSYADSDLDTAGTDTTARWVWPAIIALAVIGLIAWAFAQGNTRVNTGSGLTPAPAVTQPL